MYLTLDVLLDDLRDIVSNPDSLEKEKLSMTVLFALRDIGSSAVGEVKSVPVPILDGVATYPTDLLRLRDLKTEFGDLMYEVPVLDSHTSSALEYLQLENGVQTQQKRGKVLMVYYALVLGNDGYPLIDENIYEAVLARCLARAKMKETYKNKGLSRADLQWQIYLDREADSKIARARGNAHTPTRGRARTIRDKNGRFFKR